MADYGPLYQSAGQQWNIDPMLLQSIAQQESGQGANTGPSSAGARGFMQFMPETAARYKVDVNSPTSSVMGAAHYMDDLLQYYGGDLNAALSAYGGDASGKAGYAQSVINRYHQLQKASTPGADDAADRSSAAPQEPGPSYESAGIKITAKALPGTGGAQQGGASFVPPLGTPDTLGRSNAPGSRTQHTVDINDFAGPLESNAPAAAPAPQQPAPSNDFSGPLTAPAPAAPQPAPGVAGASPEGQQPSSAPTAPPAGASAPAPPAAPTPTTWLGRNVSAPVAAMYNPTAPQPTQNYLLGSPLLQEIGAGFLQGPRTVAQTTEGWARDLDARYPWLAALDRAAGPTWSGSLTAPDIRFGGAAPGATAGRLASETAANEQRYGGDMSYGLSDLAGQMFATYPLVWGAGLAGAGARAAGVGALPVVGRFAAPAITGAVGGAGQNMLTSPDTDWRTAALYGGAGGAAVGGTLGYIGSRFAGAAPSEVQQLADRLGIPVSRGQANGGLAQAIEDTAAPLPGAGAGQFATEQRQAIGRLLNTEMGEPGDRITSTSIAGTKARIGDDIDNALGRITISAPPGNTAFIDRLNQIEQEALANGPTTPEAYRTTALLGQIRHVLSTNNGTIPGDRLLDMLKRGNPLDLASRQAGNVGDRADDIREALMDAAQASPTAQPGAVDDLQRARYQYKVASTIQPSMQRTVGGSEEVSLPALANAIQNNRYIDKLADEPLPNLMRLINSTRNLASSGTAERSLRQKLIGLAPSEGVGGGALWALAHPQSAEQGIAVAAAPLAANVLASRALRFGPGMGVPLVEAARREFNPILPRLVGPALGRNWLTQQQNAQ